MKKYFIVFVVVISFLNQYCERVYNEPFYKTEIKKINTATPKGESYKVIKVKDGDTFVVLVNKRPLTVRFAHIDCPERYQAFGNRAKQFVAEKSFGKFVFLRDNGKYDRYGRLIAEVILEDGTNLNQALVRNGLAWHFKRYSKNQTYDSLEQLARKEKIGLWSEPNPIPPWEWRRRKREKRLNKSLFILQK